MIRLTKQSTGLERAVLFNKLLGVSGHTPAVYDGNDLDAVYLYFAKSFSGG